MKTEVKIQVRAYPVKLKDHRTGETSSDMIVLPKEMLQAAGLIGMTDEDLICRTYNQRGYKVLDIAKPPRKVELTVDLEKLVREQSGQEGEG